MNAKLSTIRHQRFVALEDRAFRARMVAGGVHCLPHGKYRGQAIKQVAAADRRYLQFLVDHQMIYGVTLDVALHALQTAEKG